jgi:hypothetical protein
MDPLSSIALAVAGTWIGAIGIGVIRIGLKLNNTVQRLTVVVTALGGEVRQHKRDIRTLRATTSAYDGRIAVLESHTQRRTP